MKYGCIYCGNGSPFHYRRTERATGDRKEKRATVGRREKEVRFEGLGALPRKGGGPGASLHPRRLPGQMFKHSEAA